MQRLLLVKHGKPNFIKPNDAPIQYKRHQRSALQVLVAVRRVYNLNMRLK